MCDLEFDSYSVVWRETHRRARKQHTCDCCHTVIQPGETYLSHFSVFDREPNNEALCSTCDALRGVFALMHNDRTPNPSSFCDLLVDCVDELGGGAEERSLRAQWQAMRRIIHNRYRAARRVA